VVEGKTGFLCNAGSAVDMARAIRAYFASELYRRLEEKRTEIRTYAVNRYSWRTVGKITCEVYNRLGGGGHKTYGFTAGSGVRR
jgi:glycosyltransferase involved in cell wall biosynthesis